MAYEATVVAAGVLGAGTLVILFYIFNESIVFPGINAAFVSLATAAIILQGELRKGLIYKVLSAKLLAYIGRLSFSLYLWHWPVLAFYRYYFNSINLLGYVLCAALTFLLAFCSWSYVEKPLRYLNIKNRWVIAFYLILPIVLLVTISKNIKLHEGYVERMPPQARNLFTSSVSSYDNVRKASQADDSYLPFMLTPIGAENLLQNKPQALLWGDSHAGHFRPFIEQLGLDNGFYSLYGGAGGCPPFIGVDLIKHGQPEAECTEVNNQLFNVIINSDSRIIFLAARWAMYTETTRSDGEKGSRVYLGDSTDYTETVENSRRAFRKGMDITIQRLIENGKQPVLFEQVPSYSFLPSNCLIKKATYEWMKNESCDIEYAKVLKRQKYANAVIEYMKEKHSQLIVVKINDLICNDDKCLSQVDEVPLYNDNDHLNMYGSAKLYELYKEKGHYKELINILKK